MPTCAFQVYFSLKRSSYTKKVQCGTKFLRVLIFAIFAGFFAIRKNKFPQNKITANFFSAKIYSTVEIIYKNTDLKKKMP